MNRIWQFSSKRLMIYCFYFIFSCYSFKMYGRYSRSLGEYARQQAAELRELEKKRKKEEKQRSKELRTYRGKWTSRFLRVVSFIWRHTFAKIGEDWVFLALLGIIVAMLSYTMDYGIAMCNTGNSPPVHHRDVLWINRELIDFLLHRRQQLACGCTGIWPPIRQCST